MENENSLAILRKLSLEIADKKILNGVDLEIRRGEFLSLVGASGSGKTLTALSLIGLLPAESKITGGEIIFAGQEISKASEREMRKLRGSEMTMIFQEPMSSLNPVMRVGEQITEAIRVHQSCSKSEAMAQAEQLLIDVQISEPAIRLRSFPHQLSGGLRQRVMIAMALSCNPSLLIADEPTTALDVTVQASVIRLLQELQASRNLSILFITHDIALAAEASDRIAVMSEGAVVEIDLPETIVNSPKDPVTIAFIERAKVS
jgi:ABC-type dipeptide/oligopeptide/nickel transport system ATPase component